MIIDSYSMWKKTLIPDLTQYKAVGKHFDRATHFIQEPTLESLSPHDHLLDCPVVSVQSNFRAVQKTLPHAALPAPDPICVRVNHKYSATKMFSVWCV